jgi:hypothetical protein
MINPSNKYYNLMQYVSENLKTHEILKEYKNNNINKNRLQLYRDFIINLCYYIGDTYLGQEIIKTNKHKKDHFRWSFSKVCNEFKEEGLDFSNDDELFDYFFEYFNSTLYENEMYEIEFLIEYWEDTLELSYDKSKADLEGMFEVYVIFDRILNTKLNYVVQ